MHKKILVTGGSGMVGRYLKNILPEAIYMSSKDCDLRDSKQVDEFWGKIKPNVVIHLGAKVGGILENLASPADFYNENTLINTNVLMMSKKHNVKREIKGRKANIKTRNFPNKTKEIKKEYKILDGGNQFIFFTTSDKGKYVIICSKLV